MRFYFILYSQPLSDDRYDAVRVCLGEELLHKLANLRLFMVWYGWCVNMVFSWMAEHSSVCVGVGVCGCVWVCVGVVVSARVYMCLHACMRVP